MDFVSLLIRFWVYKEVLCSDRDEVSTSFVVCGFGGRRKTGRTWRSGERVELAETGVAETGSECVDGGVLESGGRGGSEGTGDERRGRGDFEGEAEGGEGVVTFGDDGDMGDTGAEDGKERAGWRVCAFCVCLRCFCVLFLCGVCMPRLGGGGGEGKRGELVRERGDIGREGGGWENVAG